MKVFLKRIPRLLLGLFLVALGIVFSIQANIGYTPWEVFHVGLAQRVGISIGTVTVVSGIIIIIVSAILGEKIGFGTVANICLVGPILDAIMLLNIIPISENMLLSIAMLLLGLFISSLGIYFYISSGLGAGPRDSLMVSLARKTRLPIGFCRGAIEFMAVLSGWLLGGMVGIGTIISIFSQGAFIQMSFRLFKFDATLIRHETLSETIGLLRGSG